MYFDFDEFTVPMVIVLVIVVVLGLGLIIAGVSSIKKMNRLKLSCTAQTIGKVADIEKSLVEITDEYGDVKKTNRYYPVFEYSANGRAISYKSPFAAEKSKFKAGQEIIVFYNPQDVEQHYVQEEKIGNKKSGIIAVIFGVIFIAVAIWTFFGIGYGLVELAEWDDFWD